MINPAKLFKIKSSWEKFSSNHPKFLKYLSTVRNNALKEGTVIEISITTEDGKTLNSNIKLSKSDIELFNELSELSNNA